MDSQQYLAYHSSSIQNGQPQPVSSSSTAAWANAHSTSFVYGHPPHHVQPSGRVGELRYASTSQNASVDGGGQPDLYGTQPGATTTGTGAEFSQMTLGLDHQLDSSIGPSRGPQTRSKRIAQQQRSVSAPGLQNVLAPDVSGAQLYMWTSHAKPAALSLFCTGLVLWRLYVTSSGCITSTDTKRVHFARDADERASAPRRRST
jgi:hypothetical protein